MIKCLKLTQIKIKFRTIKQMKLKNQISNKKNNKFVIIK